MLLAIASVVAAREVLLLALATQPFPVAYLFEDDAYYALAVARNLAHGHGPTADGSQWTNGFQPLWTVLVSGPYALFEDERLVFAAICLLSTALWLASAYLFARLVHGFIAAPAQKAAVPWLRLAIAAVFLSDLQLQAAYFNGLETGLYLTLVLAILLFARPEVRLSGLNGGSIGPPLGVGIALGVMILARNDGVFLAAALLIAAALSKRTWARLRAVVVCGLALTAVLLPWLAFNVWLTGSIVPQSGLATNAGPYASDDILAKTSQLLARLAQLTYTPFPMDYGAIGTSSAPQTVLLAALSIGVGLTLAARHSAVQLPAKLVWPLAVAVVCLGAYYVMASGAVWMYDRYLMPYKLLALCAWGFFLVTWIARVPSVAVALAVFAAVGVSLYYQLGGPSPGSNMSQDALWLQESALVQGDHKIGMFESGRAAYAFPGRVINLDGKTNLAALRAIQQGEFLQYLERSDLDVLVFRAYFEPWLDAAYPAWRTVFVPEPGGLPGLVISHRVAA